MVVQLLQLLLLVVIIVIIMVNKINHQPLFRQPTITPLQQQQQLYQQHRVRIQLIVHHSVCYPLFLFLTFSQKTNLIQIHQILVYVWVFVFLQMIFLRFFPRINRFFCLIDYDRRSLLRKNNNKKKVHLSPWFIKKNHR